MKTTMKASALALLSAFVLSGTASAQHAKPHVDMTNAKKYDVVERMDMNPRPAGFQPQAAAAVNGAFNDNVMTVSRRVLNDKSFQLKYGQVQTVGGNKSAWQLMCDEGQRTYEQTALNPLSYMLGGISSSLLTRVEQAIMLMNLDVKDVKVEARLLFRYNDPMTDAWSGFTDALEANIMIDSDEPVAKLEEAKKMALQAWAVGECITNKTPVDAQYIFNSSVWDVEKGTPGYVGTDVSTDNGLTMSKKAGTLTAKTFDVGPDIPMILSNPYKFQVVGIAESANDPERPHLHKMSVRSINQNYAAWEIYADDSRGYAGLDKAPTSHEYFSVGTTLCLMSQLAGVQMFYGMKKHIAIPDYRAEHQFNYQIDNFGTPKATGHVDGVTTRILVNSDASDAVMNEFCTVGLRMCFAGDAVLDNTPTESTLYVNGKEVK